MSNYVLIISAHSRFKINASQINSYIKKEKVICKIKCNKYHEKNEKSSVNSEEKSHIFADGSRWGQKDGDILANHASPGQVSTADAEGKRIEEVRHEGRGGAGHPDGAVPPSLSEVMGDKDQNKTRMILWRVHFIWEINWDSLYQRREREMKKAGS